MTSRDLRKQGRIHLEALDLQRQPSKMVIDLPASSMRFYVPRSLRLVEPGQPALALLACQNETVLEWSADSDAQEVVYRPVVQDYKNCLTEFIRLHDAPDADYLHFAQRWGVLGRITRGYTDYGKPMVRICREPISAWRFYVNEFRTLLLMTASLLKEALIPKRQFWFLFSPDLDTLEQLNRSMDGFTLVPIQHTPVPSYDNLLFNQQCQCDVLMAVVTDIAKSYGATFRYEWRSAERRIVLDVASWKAEVYPSPLMKLLVLQLCEAVTSTNCVYECDICGHPFTPKKQRPHAGRAACCGSEACKRIQNNAAQRRRRSKQRYTGE